MSQSAIEGSAKVVVDLHKEAPIRVLHVDDERDFLKASKQILEMHAGLQVDTATSVMEAEKMIRQKKYDVIVCDYLIPGKDGLEFLKDLRESGNKIPFIIFTGRGRETVAIRALNLGADLYVSKIGDPETVYKELAHGIRKLAEARQIEKELIRSENEKRIILDAMSDLVTYQDSEHRVLWANKAAAESVGSTPEQLAGRRCYEIWHGRNSVCLGCPVEHTLKTGQQHEGEITTPDGRVWLVRGHPIKDDKGIVVGIVEVTSNITERKKAEETLRKGQEKFERLLANYPEPTVFLDPNFRIENVNPRFQELFGYSLEEVKGKHVNEVLVPKESMEEAKPLDRKARKGYAYFETVRRKKDGSLVPVSISVAPITVEGQLIGYIAVYKDVSRLEESRKHFETLFNLMVDPVAIVDKKGKILAVTEKVEEITGFKKEELVGKNFLRTKIASAKSKALMIKNLTKRMMGMRLAPYEVEILTKDGRKIPFEINAEKINYKGKPADMVVFRDISERKKLEAKLRVVGRLTRHDVRNKLSTVAMNVFLAKQKLPRGHEALKHLREIEAAVKEAGRIFDFARIYEKIGMEELTYMDVGKAFSEAAMLFSDLQGIKVVNNCKGLTVLADSLLRQLFYNLIDNSLRHGKKVSQIRVYYEKTGENQLKLVYEDDGVGIPKAEKKQIFKEGYGKNTGYGLYLVKQICSVYSWSIHETGIQGKGAQFTMLIPKISGGKPRYKLR